MYKNERETLKKFGLRVSKLRSNKSLTQEGLAEATNLDRMTVAFIEGGRRWPRLETLIALANALDVKLSDFFKDL